MISVLFLLRNLTEKRGRWIPELSGVISLLFLIRNAKEKGKGGSGAFRNDFLIGFDKEPSGKGREEDPGAFRGDFLIVFNKEP